MFPLTVKRLVNNLFSLFVLFSALLFLLLFWKDFERTIPECCTSFALGEVELSRRNFFHLQKDFEVKHVCCLLTQIISSKDKQIFQRCVRLSFLQFQQFKLLYYVCIYAYALIPLSYTNENVRCSESSWTLSKLSTELPLTQLFLSFRVLFP